MNIIRKQDYLETLKSLNRGASLNAAKLLGMLVFGIAAAVAGQYIAENHLGVTNTAVKILISYGLATKPMWDATKYLAKLSDSLVNKSRFLKVMAYQSSKKYSYIK